MSAHELEAVVLGTGGPTVVFESDIGSPFGVWTRVQPLVSEFATTVAYSRAGLGASDMAAGTRSPRQVVEELRTLLRGLGREPPYVLVGHSFGSLLTRAFFYEYPQEVAGLVLVNDTDERVFREWKAVNPSWIPRPAAWDDEARLAEVAMLRQVQDAGSLPNRRPLAGMPVYILTRGRPAGLFPGDRLGLNVVRSLHADLFSDVTDGAHIVAGRSNHKIHVTEPELVAWSIRQVVGAARR